MLPTVSFVALHPSMIEPRSARGSGTDLGEATASSQDRSRSLVAWAMKKWPALDGW